MTAILAVSSVRPSPTSAQQDVLTTNIDRTGSPRDDFFQYANGEWLKQHPIPDDQARWGVANLISDDVYSQLRRISEDAAAKRGRRGSAEQLIGDFWATGMDAATINRQGLSPLQPDLDRIDRIQSIAEVIDVVATMHRRTMLIDGPLGQQRVFFSARVEQDESDSRRRIYTVSQGGVSMRRPAYTAGDPQSVKVRKAFRDYLFKIFMRLYRDGGRAAGSADAVFNLEATLAASFEPGNDSHRIGSGELGRFTTLDWKRYFGDLGVGSIEFVNMRQPQFFQTLDSALRATPLDHWKDYLRYWLVRLNAPFLDDEAYGDFFAFESAITGQPQPRPRWRRVVWEEKNWLGLPLVKLFDQEYLPERTKARYRAVGESIRDAFKSRIEHLEWMSDSTKKNALVKLARLKIIIGVPENSIDFSTMPLRRDSYVLNMIRAAEWFHDRQIERLNRPVDATALDLHPGIGGDAYYDDSNNELQVPSPVRALGVRDDDLDDAFVYGSTPLGHEISHAFDSEGRHYDAYGNKVDWWTAPDAAAFDARAQAMIDQYSQFMPLEGLRIDGRRTLRENMADFVGVRVALDAFKKTLQFRKDERIGGLTALQRFLLAYAYSFMGHERDESLATRLKGGAYAPNRERVNGVVMNLPEFYEAFDVKPGDRMYRPEGTRVRIW
ncbi:MAG TPA: M13 family metallopeptidase [Vicinamibacterales bacterium]|nr:M13 family metallopeptidase [Vicinamibacterales bacterium]